MSVIFFFFFFPCLLAELLRTQKIEERFKEKISPLSMSSLCYIHNPKYVTFIKHYFTYKLPKTTSALLDAAKRLVKKKDNQKTT